MYDTYLISTSEYSRAHLMYGPGTPKRMLASKTQQVTSIQQGLIGRPHALAHSIRPACAVQHTMQGMRIDYRTLDVFCTTSNKRPYSEKVRAENLQRSFSIPSRRVLVQHTQAHMPHSSSHNAIAEVKIAHLFDPSMPDYEHMCRRTFDQRLHQPSSSLGCGKGQNGSGHPASWRTQTWPPARLSARRHAQHPEHQRGTNDSAADHRSGEHPLHDTAAGAHPPPDSQSVTSISASQLTWPCPHRAQPGGDASHYW